MLNKQAAYGHTTPPIDARLAEPKSHPSWVKRFTLVLFGTLTAAISAFGAVLNLAGALRSGDFAAMQLLELAALVLAYATGVFVCAYGWHAMDAGKARRMTVMVLLITAAAAALCLAGGLSWGSDNDNDGDSGGKESRDGSRFDLSLPHFWGSDAAHNSDHGQARRRTDHLGTSCLGCGRYMAGGSGLCEACLWQQHR